MSVRDYVTGEKRLFSLSNFDDQLDAPFLGLPTTSGVSVTVVSSLENTAVWNAITLLSQTLALVPLKLFRRVSPRGKVEARENTLFNILHIAPNPEMTSFNWREVQMGSLLGWGNAYSEIQFDPRTGRVVALWPIPPERVKVKRIEGKLFYDILLPTGMTVTLPAFRMLHVPGFSFDGIVGMSPIQLHRNAIGLGLATEEFGARFFGNGAIPGGVITHPNTLSQLAGENIKKSWNKAQQGLTNAQRINILDEGMKYEKIGIAPEDAQFLQTRKFQVTEIARIYNVPPSMIGDLEKATFTNIEQQSLNFIRFTMLPWFKRWEQVFDKKLLGPNERLEFFAEFNAEGLLRGDSEARSNFYQKLFSVGALSPNDIRDKENMNPIVDGDQYFVPSNFQQLTAIEAPGDDLENNRNLVPAKQKLRESFLPAFNELALKLVRAERREVMKHSGKDGFTEWRTGYYATELPKTVKKLASPVLRTFMLAIAASEQEDKGLATIDIDKLDEVINKQIDEFTTRYLKGNDVVEGDLTEMFDRRESECQIAEDETRLLGDCVASHVCTSVGIVRG